MQDPTATAIAWLRAKPRRLPLFSIATVAAGTMLHVAVTVISDVWPAIIVVALDLVAALMLMIGGAFIALYGIEQAATAERLRYPDVWEDPTGFDNISPGPSAENGGLFVIPPEAMGSICIGGNPATARAFIDGKKTEWDGDFAGNEAGYPADHNPYQPTHASSEVEEFGSNYPHLAEVHEEVLAQFDQWGQQNHPNGTGGTAAKINRTNAHKAVEAAAAAKDGSLTWAMILKEEFTEALAEENLEKLDRELTQIAAVCVSWKQAIARQISAYLGVEANPK